MAPALLMRNKKQVFVKLKLITGDEELTSIIIDAEQTPEEIKHLLKLKCDLTDDSLILKLRNDRGSVVPIAYRSFGNTSREVPYSLEAVQPHTTCPLTPRSVQNDKTYSLEDRVQSISERLGVLEEAIIALPERRNKKITEDLNILEGQMLFLMKKMDDAKASNWKGMFQKNPLW